MPRGIHHLRNRCIRCLRQLGARRSTERRRLAGLAMSAPEGRARRMVRRGRELRHLPACSRAWADGAITSDQVDAIAALRVDATETALARDEEMLAMQGSTLRHDSFVRALAYWRQLADPDGADEADERRLGRRDVYLESSFRGMWLGRITLDPVSGSIVAGELERIEQELFRGGLGQGTDQARAGAALDRPGAPWWPTAGRCPGRDGHAQSDRSGRRATSGPTVQRARRLRHPPWSDLRTRRRHRGGSGFAASLVRRGLPRAGRVRARKTCRSQPHRTTVHGSHPAGDRAEGSGMHPSLLRRPRRILRSRPRGPVCPRWGHDAGERSDALWFPQSLAKPTGEAR